jgi:hypothetical protein
MLRNVGALLLGFANIKVRPDDIIEVIRFLYVSPIIIKITIKIII